MTFAEAIRDLPQAVETGRFNALVEPSRTLEQAREGDAETVPVVQRSHRLVAIINPVDVYGPLEEVLREEAIDGTPLGDVMFGEIRRYRGRRRPRRSADWNR